MNTRAMLMNGLAMLVLFLAPIAASGCATPADPGGSADEGPPTSAFQAVVDDDPAFVRELGTCQGVADLTVDTGQIGSQGSTPTLEIGTCADPFTINDPVDMNPADPYDIQEAAEICGRTGASSTFLKYYGGPGDIPPTPTTTFCTDYSGQFFSDGQARRRWVSTFGCCAAGTSVPPQTVPLTQTNRDCGGIVIPPELTPTFGSATIGPNSSGQLVAAVALQGAAIESTYTVRLIQTPNSGSGSAECSTIDGMITTDASGNGSVIITETLLATTADAFVAINLQSDPGNVFFTSAEVFF